MLSILDVCTANRLVELLTPDCLMFSSRLSFAYRLSVVIQLHVIINNRSSKKDTLFELANSNPRDLWHIFNELIKTQFHNNPDLKVFEPSTINEALTKFITGFNYYEYYPCMINARANTMDIYSYIALLQRLPNYKFTKNQLNSYVRTGSSTSNYVVGMERIGLIEKDSQQQGAIIYRIKDPKVRYALRKSLKIEKP